MSVTETVLAKLQTLSDGDQRKVLEFVDSLQVPHPQEAQRQDPKGMFAHRGVHVTTDMIEEARREAWAGVPREFPND